VKNGLGNTNEAIWKKGAYEGSGMGGSDDGRRKLQGRERGDRELNKE